MDTLKPATLEYLGIHYSQCLADRSAAEILYRLGSTHPRCFGRTKGGRVLEDDLQRQHERRTTQRLDSLALYHPGGLGYAKRWAQARAGRG